MVRALFVVLFCLASPLVVSATPEELYLQERNAYLRDLEAHNASNFAKPPSQDALPKLEAQLKAIVGAVAVEGFSGKGRIDLDNYYVGEYDFGPADGLTFRNKRERLFVTARGLLNLLNLREPNVTALASDPKFSEASFGLNAAVTNCADIPLKGFEEKSAYAFLGTMAQDDGPVPPHIFAFAMKGDRMLAVLAEPTTKFRPRFPCHGKALTGQAAFAKAAQQAQAIVDRLHGRKPPAAR